MKDVLPLRKFSHKFVWSVPCNSYTLAAVCEYCGLVVFDSNNSSVRKEHIPSNEPCPGNLP